MKVRANGPERTVAGPRQFEVERIKADDHEKDFPDDAPPMLIEQWSQEVKTSQFRQLDSMEAFLRARWQARPAPGAQEPARHGQPSPPAAQAPLAAASRPEVPPPGQGRPSAQQRGHIYDLRKRCDAAKVQHADVAQPEVAQEADDVIQVLQARLRERINQGNTPTKVTP